MSHYVGANMTLRGKIKIKITLAAKPAGPIEVTLCSKGFQESWDAPGLNHQNGSS
jgi:hypothetical protein